MKPEFSIVSRWKGAMPQYTVGHKERLKQMSACIQDQLPGVFVAGSSFDGLGLPDCIDQGEAAVEKTLEFLSIKIISQIKSPCFHIKKQGDFIV